MDFKDRPETNPSCIANTALAAAGIRSIDFRTVFSEAVLKPMGLLASPLPGTGLRESLRTIRSRLVRM